MQLNFCLCAVNGHSVQLQDKGVFGRNDLPFESILEACIRVDSWPFGVGAISLRFPLPFLLFVPPVACQDAAGVAMPATGIILSVGGGADVEGFRALTAMGLFIFDSRPVPTLQRATLAPGGVVDSQLTFRHPHEVYLASCIRRALLERILPCSGVLQHATVAVFDNTSSSLVIKVLLGSFMLVYFFTFANDA
jgi:hypothetical protein